MADTDDVLAPDGSVLQYRDDQSSEITEVCSRAQHDQLIADGWIALDERIEQGEEPKRPYDSTAERIAALPRFLAYYIGYRPHGGLDGDTPLGRLTRSTTS